MRGEMLLVSLLSTGYNIAVHVAEDTPQTYVRYYLDNFHIFVKSGWFPKVENPV